MVKFDPTKYAPTLSFEPPDATEGGRLDVLYNVSGLEPFLASMTYVTIQADNAGCGVGEPPSTGFSCKAYIFDSTGVPSFLSNLVPASSLAWANNRSGSIATYVRSYTDGSVTRPFVHIAIHSLAIGQRMYFDKPVLKLTN
jgi:hypothetical protein